jgi:hypothetical protein
MTTSPAAPGDDSPGESPDTTDPEEVDVLSLAGRLPAAEAEWLLITEAGGLPGTVISAWLLPAGQRQGRGGDVLVRLAPGSGHADRGPVTVDVSAWVVISGRLVPVATWDQQEPGAWPERIRPTVVFALDVLTELEDHQGADLGAGNRVELDTAAAKPMPGIPAGLTFGPPRG